MPEAIYVTRPSMPPFDEYPALIKELWSNRRLTNMGKFHEEFRQKLREYLLADYVDLFANGHMALELSLQALLENAAKGSEIITTPFTFVSTIHAYDAAHALGVRRNSESAAGFGDISVFSFHARKYFYPLASSFECLRGKFDPDKTPVALDISRRILTLPIYSELTSAEVERICRILRAQTQH